MFGWVEKSFFLLITRAGSNIEEKKQKARGLRMRMKRKMFELTSILFKESRHYPLD